MQQYIPDFYDFVQMKNNPIQGLHQPTFEQFHNIHPQQQSVLTKFGKVGSAFLFGQKQIQKPDQGILDSQLIKNIYQGPKQMFKGLEYIGKSFNRLGDAASAVNKNDGGILGMFSTVADGTRQVLKSKNDMQKALGTLSGGAIHTATSWVPLLLGLYAGKKLYNKIKKDGISGTLSGTGNKLQSVIDSAGDLLLNQNKQLVRTISTAGKQLITNKMHNIIGDLSSEQTKKALDTIFQGKYDGYKQKPSTWKQITNIIGQQNAEQLKQYGKKAVKDKVINSLGLQKYRKPTMLPIQSQESFIDSILKNQRKKIKYNEQFDKLPSIQKFKKPYPAIKQQIMMGIPGQKKAGLMLAIQQDPMTIDKLGHLNNKGIRNSVQSNTQ